ncbi:MAG TPA: thiamine pyrophosphate-binding protein [Gemmataceae bacterium]|nr:thiamine pyrophosphate-binding protein [Gemmataceae bacterium]
MATAVQRETQATTQAITGGHLVARALKAEGIETIFTLSGGHIMDIYDGCADAGIRIVDVRHEQSAAHAADAWTRLTGIPGCAVVTAGPGTTDAVTAVANAWRAQVPMLLIGGQGPLKQAQMGSLQELDHVGLMKPITKFATTVYHTERIPEILGMAFRQAYSGRPGPVFVEIPADVLFTPVPESAVVDPGKYRSIGKTYGDVKLVEEAARLLAGAQRPTVLAGSQVWQCRGVVELRALAEGASLPVYLNGAARGSLPPGHPLLFVQSRREALARADVILVLGTPFDFRLGYGKRLAPEAKILQVDLDYGELGHNRGVDIGITGDAAAVLGQLAAAVGKVPAERRKAWLDHLRATEQRALEKELPLLNSDAVPIHPLRLAREINDFMTEDTIFIGDGGDIVTISASVVQTYLPGQWLDPGPLGTLGVGMPFAIAAKLAQPHKEAFILFGDGAFGFNGFEFDTALRFRLPIVSVVGNNAAWNQVRYGQIARYGTARGDIANLLAPTRYDRVVEALGGHGEHVTEPKDIRPALERARAAGKAACVNVMIDPNVYSSGTMNQTMYK